MRIGGGRRSDGVPIKTSIFIMASSVGRVIQHTLPGKPHSPAQCVGHKTTARDNIGPGGCN